MKERVFHVLMDYRCTVEELISGGNVKVLVSPESEYLLTSASIPSIMSKNEQVRFLQEIPITIVSFAKKVTTKTVIKEAKKAGLRPANIFELLALNRTYPASPGIKKSYALHRGVVSLGTLLPKKHKGKTIKFRGANLLAPLLCCEEGPRDPLRRRELRLNLTEFVDDIDGSVRESDEWWPVNTQFACTLI